MTHSCTRCGERLPPVKGPGRPRLYCGPCRKATIAEQKRTDRRNRKVRRIATEEASERGVQVSAVLTEWNRRTPAKETV